MSTIEEVDRIKVFWAGNAVVCVLIHMVRAVLKTAQTPLPTIVKLSLWFKVVPMRRVINVFMQQSIQRTMLFFIIVVLINWLEDCIKVRVVVRFIVHRLVVK